MVSMYQSNKDTDSEPHELQERYETNSDDEKVKNGVKKINISTWEENNQINTKYMYEKEFPPLPTINNTFPTYINTHSPLSSVSLITIERKKESVQQSRWIFKNRKKNDSPNTPSIHSHNQLTLHSHITHKTITQTIPLSVSIPPTKRTTRKNYKQDSKTTTSSRHSYDSNWETSQPDRFTPPHSPTPIETNSDLIKTTYSNKISTYLNNRNSKQKINTKIKNLFYKNKNYQSDIQNHNKQNIITIENPKSYNKTFPQ